MATATATSQARYPHSFHVDADGNTLVVETMRIGAYKSKSDMLRDAVKKLNAELKEAKE